MSDPINVLIFSKDRALQVQATLESFFLHCRDAGQAEVYVLYKTSDSLHAAQYDRLRSRFPEVCFVKEQAFRHQVLAILRACDHVLFSVDDTLFVGDFRLTEAVQALNADDRALGVSLRLGRNTTYCYSRNCPQWQPPFMGLGQSILKYDWTGADHDFGYALEVSSSLYRSADLLGLLERGAFSNPNTLEDLMASHLALYRDKDRLLCFDRSVAFCAPVNVVQTVWPNRAGEEPEYAVTELARKFDQGLRIDVRRYDGFVPNACHQEVTLHLTDGQSMAGFSIVMANYNNGRYIGRAIESVLAQTFQAWELIVVDDCSTDDSVEVIGRYLQDRRIRLIRHYINRGCTASFKTGIARVRFEVFGILDSDDALTPQAVERMYEQHLRRPDCGLIYSQFVFCHPDLTPRAMGFCARIAPGRSNLDAPSASHFKTFKTRDYLKTEGYDERILYAEDVDLVYKMEEVAGLDFVDKPLYLHRETPGSISRSKDKINTALLSRAKAKTNALKRRCRTGLSDSRDRRKVFQQAVSEARTRHEDVDQYFVLLTQLYENRLLAGIHWPEQARTWSTEQAVLWIAAHVDIPFDRLFGPGRSLPITGRHRLPVTVDMVTYNAERTIGRAIASVLAQTFQDFELVIVDDGSTDRTAQIIRSFSDDRIRYVAVPHRNCATAKNRAIAEAAGEYLLSVDSDDAVSPDYLEKMMVAARRFPEADYLYPRTLDLVNEADEPIGRWEYGEFPDSRELLKALYEQRRGLIPNPASLKRRALFERTGPYEDLETVEDFVFLCRHALQIRFQRVTEHGQYFYRRSPTSNSQKISARDRIISDILEKMPGLYAEESPDLVAGHRG